MQVLFLYPRVLDKKTSVGGVAEFLFALTPALRTMGVNAVIYGGDKTRMTLSTPTYLNEQVTLYHGPFMKPGMLFPRSYLKPVIEVCQRENIQLTHAQGTYTAGCLARELYQRLNIPYVVTSHSDIVGTNSRRINRRNVQSRCRQVLKHARAVTHLTPQMAAVSHALCDTRLKSLNIPNGIDCAAWSDYLALPEKDYLLGIGRLEPGKGFHVLIDVYASMVKQGLKTSLIIAGHGSAREDLQAQVRSLGLAIQINEGYPAKLPAQTVIFTGYVRGEHKKQLIAQSKGVVFATQPSLWEEAFGIVQLEAMAAGKAIVASSTHATAYLCELGMQALTVTPDHQGQWVQALTKILQDQTLRQRLGQENLKASRQFEWQQIATQYRQVYQQCLNN